MSPDPEFHNPANPLAVAHQNDLLAKLQEWSQAFERYPTRLSISPSPGPIPNAAPREAQRATLLRLHYKFLYVKLSVCLACGLEVTYDERTDDFEALVSLAADLIGHDGRNDTTSSPPSCRLPTFSLDIGLIQPVYFTALKCRIPQPRRRALSLLSSTPHREGMWDATLQGTFAARIIELEEAAGFSLPGGGTEDQPRSLPGGARFCEVHIHILGEGYEGAALYCKQRNSDPPHNKSIRKEYCAFDGGAPVREILLS